jgi:hypothetical protein
LSERKFTTKGTRKPYEGGSYRESGSEHLDLFAGSSCRPGERIFSKAKIRERLIQGIQRARHNSAMYL